MTEEEHLKYYFNEVKNLTAFCRSNKCYLRGEYPELEIGMTYKVTHIGVLRSSTKIMLSGFEGREYNASCFDIMENGVNIDNVLAKDNRFLAPYLRSMFCSYHEKEEIETSIIPYHLRNIETEYDVRILLAVESGSRAWGFESGNSDWDVRFIYVHKPEWYFKVEDQRDVIELLYEDNVDIVGWELRKALSLLKRSNPSLLEWLHSPKVYYMDEDFRKRIKAIEDDYFNPTRSMYHYNHIYSKHNEPYLQNEEYPMKPFFYYLRGILACKWIEMYKTLPPVPFDELVNATVEDKGTREKIDKLIEIKRSGQEHNLTVVDKDLMEYAKHWADYYDKNVGCFRPDMNATTADKLDSILYDMVMADPLGRSGQ